MKSTTMTNGPSFAKLRLQLQLQQQQQLRRRQTQKQFLQPFSSTTTSTTSSTSTTTISKIQQQQQPKHQQLYSCHSFILRSNQHQQQYQQQQYQQQQQRFIYNTTLNNHHHHHLNHPCKRVGNVGGVGSSLPFKLYFSSSTSSSSWLPSWIPSFSSSKSSSSNSSLSLFDPLDPSLPSSNVIKQPDIELTLEERQLKVCLQQYQQEMETITEYHENDNDDNSDSNQQVLPLLPMISNELQLAYEALQYWEEALGMEEWKYQYYLMELQQQQKQKQQQQQNDNDIDVDLESIKDAIADSLHMQGKYHLRLSHFQQSKEYYEQALEYFSKNNQNSNNNKNTIQLGHVKMSLAGWYFFAHEDLEMSLSLLKESESLLERSNNPALLYKCFDNQGLIYRLQDEYELALECYQQALSLVSTTVSTTTTTMSSSSSSSLVSSTLEEQRVATELHIGDMLLALDRYDESLQTYQQLLLSLKEDSTNFGIQGVIWHQMATIHVALQQYALAEQEYHQAIAFKQMASSNTTTTNTASASSMNANPELAKTWCALGQLQANHLSTMGHKRQAIESFQNVLWIARIHSNNDSNDPNVLQAIQMITKLQNEIKNE